MHDKIEVHVDLCAPITRVWRALVDHTEFGAWFRVRLDGPFVVGEPSTGQITYAGYEHLKWRATVLQMDAEQLFVLSWCPYAKNPDVDNPDEPQTRVEFRLAATADGTHLTITESGFSDLPADGRAEAWRSNNEGWQIQAKNIAAHVEP